MRPLDCLSSMATRKLLGELAPRCETLTGRGLAVRSVGGVDAAKEVRAGAVLDIVVLAAPVMERLEAEGFLRRGSGVPLALSSAAFAVRAGEPAPDLATDEAARRSLAAAAGIAYSTGPSGDHLMAVLDRWGLMPALSDKLVKAAPGVPVGSLVAAGQAALGYQQYSELFGLPGLEILTTLAPSLAATTVFAGAVAASSADPEAAARTLAAMADPAAAPVYEACGLTLSAGQAV